jgi:hypothetical protein
MSDRPDQTKIHETAEDRAREKAIVDAFAKKFNYKVWRNTALSSHDAVFYDGETRLKAGAGEIKQRNNSRETYPTFTIDVKKIDALWKQTQKANIKAFLIVRWLDEIWYCEFKEPPNFPALQQENRQRSEDADLVYHIPIENFIQLEAKIGKVPEPEAVAPEREWKHEETCAGCYELEPGVFMHPPRNGGPRVLTEEEIHEWHEQRPEISAARSRKSA